MPWRRFDSAGREWSLLRAFTCGKGRPTGIRTESAIELLRIEGIGPLFCDGFLQDIGDAPVASASVGHSPSFWIERGLWSPSFIPRFGREACIRGQPDQCRSFGSVRGAIRR